jgi:peptide-methionine (S)-S-oxide reductase
MTTYVLGGGCFWCLDAIYRQVSGVSSVASGYAGGHDETPNYYRVVSGLTGHAEVVEIVFDETIIPPEVILDIYLLSHDPTSLNRQGADVGDQYRSIMLYKNDGQKLEFESAVKRSAGLFDKPIVTVIQKLDNFYPAEDEHQDYFNKNPATGYCSVVIAPKLTKVRSQYRQWLK